MVVKIGQPKIEDWKILEGLWSNDYPTPITINQHQPALSLTNMKQLFNSWLNMSPGVFVTANIETLRICGRELCWTALFSESA